MVRLPTGEQPHNPDCWFCHGFLKNDRLAPTGKFDMAAGDKRENASFEFINANRAIKLLFGIGCAVRALTLPSGSSEPSGTPSLDCIFGPLVQIHEGDIFFAIAESAHVIVAVFPVHVQNLHGDTKKTLPKKVRIPASPPFFLPGNGLTGKAGGHPEDIRRRPVRFRELVYELPEEVSRPAAPCVAVAVHEAVSVAGIHLVRRIVEFRESIAFTPQHPSPVFVDDAPDILPSAQLPSSLKHRVPEIRRPRLQDILRPEDGVPHPFGDFRRRNLREYEPHLGCPGELSVCAASPVETELFVKASAVEFPAEALRFRDQLGVGFAKSFGKQRGPSE